MIHRKKNRPALQRCDIFTVSFFNNLPRRFHIISSSSSLFFYLNFFFFFEGGGGGILFLCLFSDLVDFSYSEGSFF